MKHHLTRTSPKGQAFVGACYLCGMTGLKFGDARKDCENIRGLSVEEALVEAVTGVAHTSHDTRSPTTQLPTKGEPQ